jgi:hypothetical protein
MNIRLRAGRIVRFLEAEFGKGGIMKALRIALASAQVACFALFYAVGKFMPQARIADTPNGMAFIMGGFGLVVVASAVLSGILAHKLKRSAPLWVIGSFFIPFLVPFILSFLKETPDTRYVAPDRNAPAPALAADGSLPAFSEQGYCARCVAETTDESPGSVSTMNGVGTALQGTRWSAKGLDPCPACGSVVQQKWRMFGFGVKALGTYRILYVKHGVFSNRYFGRRLRNDPVLAPSA